MNYNILTWSSMCHKWNDHFLFFLQRNHYYEMIWKRREVHHSSVLMVIFFPFLFIFLLKQISKRCSGGILSVSFTVMWSIRCRGRNERQLNLIPLHRQFISTISSKLSRDNLIDWSVTILYLLIKRK